MVKLANLSNWGFYPLCFTYRLLFLEQGKWPFSPVVSGTWLRSSYQVTNGWEMFTTNMDSATKIRTECSQFFSYLRLPPPVTLPAVIYLGFLGSHWSRVITWSGYWPLIGPAVIYLGFSAKRSNKGYYSAAGWTQWWGKLGEWGPGAGLGEGNVCNDGCRQWDVEWWWLRDVTWHDDMTSTWQQHHNRW